jgi:hypothetical protein
MQEFSSISVSSYEAGALADRLTEHSRDGWSVVAVVPTGSTITAYLSRATDAVGTGAVSTPAADEPSHDSTADLSAADGSVEPADDPVTEAPGWGAGAATTATDDSVESTDTATVTAASTPASAPTAGGAAPAGWYADPSSRFELRYWDGTQWTEHVSRSGQQYTDPPVA